MNDAIMKILSEEGIDPDQMVGDQTAFQVMEKWVIHALDEINNDVS